MIISDLSYFEFVSEPNVVGGARAPECVTKNVTTFRGLAIATIENKCPTRQTVKAIWNFATDGSCQTLEPSATATSSRFLATLERVDLC